MFYSRTMTTVQAKGNAKKKESCTAILSNAVVTESKVISEITT